jgi:hypothetical protein
MTRRFAIGHTEITPSQQKDMRAHFDEIGTWWNWFPEHWLIVARGSHMTASMVRDKFNAVCPGVYVMVTEIHDPSGWAGYGPNTPEKDMYKWIEGIWMRGYND